MRASLTDFAKAVIGDYLEEHRLPSRDLTQIFEVTELPHCDVEGNSQFMVDGLPSSFGGSLVVPQYFLIFMS